MTEPDTTTLTGAQFQREVAADPEKWAGAFLAAAGSEQRDRLPTEADRLAFTTQWFRAAMDAAVAEAVRHTPWPSQPCPPTP
jgi:predicted oxidoreductase